MKKTILFLLFSIIISQFIFGQKIKSIKKDDFDDYTTVSTNSLTLEDKFLSHRCIITFQKVFTGHQELYYIKLFHRSQSSRVVLKDYYFRIKLKSKEIITLETRYSTHSTHWNSGWYDLIIKYPISSDELIKIRDSKIVVCRIETSDGYLQVKARGSLEKKTRETIDLILNYNLSDD